MQPHTTDANTEPLPRRHRTWLALTGLTEHQLGIVLTLIGETVVPAARGRP